MPDSPQTFESLRAERRAVRNYGGTTLISQRPPDAQGPGGMMWKIHVESNPQTRDGLWGAILGLWLLHVPDAHPMWEYYILMVYHLRQLPNMPPPHLTAPSMAYSMTCATLDPSCPVPNLGALERADGYSVAHMEPSDFTLQFPDVTEGRDTGDVLAVTLGDAFALAVVENRFAPLLDYRVQWAQLLSQELSMHMKLPSKLVM